MTVTPQSKSTHDAASLVPRAALAFVVLMALVWLIGFLRFTDSIAREPPPEEIKADAIAVLTGGAQRLGAGFRLLREGRGAKLFVSGVNADVRPDDLHALAVEHNTTAPPDFPRCCVELGFQAQDTRGNASEIADWVHAGNIGSLIVVTSNYHMPRAQVELQAVLPGTRIHPHPVIARAVMLGSWWKWPGSLVLLIGEYHKLLLAGFRLMGTGRA
jgi:uncharacterized SAM-binding protein YcdF (DUF218 family)